MKGTPKIRNKQMLKTHILSLFCPSNLSPTLSKLLGHKRVSTTQIYAEVLGESKKRTIELLDE